MDRSSTPPAVRRAAVPRMGVRRRCPNRPLENPQTDFADAEPKYSAGTTQLDSMSTRWQFHRDDANHGDDIQEDSATEPRKIRSPELENPTPGMASPSRNVMTPFCFGSLSTQAVDERLLTSEAAVRGNNRSSTSWSRFRGDARNRTVRYPLPNNTEACSTGSEFLSEKDSSVANTFPNVDAGRSSSSQQITTSSTG